ncbi:MAG: methyltransferase domain-containing protein [Candidatus Sulfotelmatobacter sp.]
MPILEGHSDYRPGEETLAREAEIVSFDSAENFPAWYGTNFVRSLISTYGCKRILEIGSGANPTLEPQFVRELSLSYVTSDLSCEEMEKADPAFERLVLDMSAEEIKPDLIGQFDLVFSRMVAEHVSDGEKYHRNIYHLLRRGGISAHCFSTLWSLPFVANWALPEFVTACLLKGFAPRDEHRHGKFPARYSWSRGPTAAMMRRFEGLGFEVVRYTGYFGHDYYRRVSRLIHQIEASKQRLLLRWPLPAFCSYATIVLRKP